MRILKWIGGFTGLAALAGLAIGVLVGAPVADSVDRYFSSNEFCAGACHVMTATVATEFEESTHATTTTGVVPKCANCHVSETLLGAYVNHVKGLSDLYAQYIKGIDTVEEFEGVRFEAANKVRMNFVATDSANCRTCHVLEKIQPERVRGQRQHAEAREKNITCIVCHYDLVHKSTPLSEEFEAVVSSF